MICTIYRATCAKTGKSYVGFDSRWPQRMFQHKHTAFKSPYNNRFYNAIRKHGWDSFAWEVLYQSLDWEHCLRVMEPHFIALHGTFHVGYNSTVGGEGGPGYRHSPESLLRMSLAKRGKTLSPEHRAKIGAANRGRTLPARARKLASAETRLKMSLSAIARAPATLENRARLSASKTGVKMARETKEKIAAAHRGKKFSPEHRARIGLANARRKRL